VLKLTNPIHSHSVSSGSQPVLRILWTREAWRGDRFRQALQEAIAGVADMRPLPPEASALGGPILDLSGTLQLAPGMEVWRFETSLGRPLPRRLAQAANWHRPPFAAAIRLMRYCEERAEGEILGEAVIGTRQSYRAILFDQTRKAALLLRQALEHGRIPAAAPPLLECRSNDGPLTFMIGGARRVGGLASAAFLNDEWCIGIADAPITAALASDRLSITWMPNPTRDSYHADPFRWPGTSRILCEEFSFRTQKGRLVAAHVQDGKLCLSSVLLDLATHLSYPYAFQQDGTVYVVPESADSRETLIYRLDPDSSLKPISIINRGSRIVDTTVFRVDGVHWAAYTDLDIGVHDNLCLAYARQLTGPWTPHLRNPVKMDIRSSRPGGTPFWHGGVLYRPAQDCAATYGNAVVINRILSLTTTEFHEFPVARLDPDPAGPFPHGFHTISADGERTMIDGKRRRLRPAASVRKAFHCALNRTRHPPGGRNC
jgi:hypothetical protein